MHAMEDCTLLHQARVAQTDKRPGVFIPAACSMLHADVMQAYVAMHAVEHLMHAGRVCCARCFYCTTSTAVHESTAAAGPGIWPACQPVWLSRVEGQVEFMVGTFQRVFLGAYTAPHSRGCSPYQFSVVRHVVEDSSRV